MEESYDEGIASHVGPESCAVACKGQGEALTGVRAGRVLSRENCDALTGSSGSRRRRTARKATADAAVARVASVPCAVVDPVARMETPRTGIGRSPGRLHIRGGRIGKWSSRQGRNPVGESPTLPIARFRQVAMPQVMTGNCMINAWCKRPGRPSRKRCGGSSRGA